MGFSIATTALRAIPGAFILNSGVGKLGMPREMAEGLQGMAASGVPKLGEITPEQFAKFVSYGEIAVGAALLAPMVPKRIAGAALGTFAAGMLAMYFRNPAMTEEDGVRPSQDGTALAKDAWLAAIAIALIFGRK
ncbi:hypothetical protein MTQ12_13250 [Brevibacterium sp. R8603A2]|uniref:hypothetical protein n=1 Tax=Brevibacterium sp. R8603A2 TaxID=2929779 RepID=UPI001FF78049|nr:hypothetical protein [Brevibacterium sp. R8603A2]MCK1804003.1 hypothetical protein [Brevibacterium sp. R8603A2]